MYIKKNREMVRVMLKSCRIGIIRNKIENRQRKMWYERKNV